MKALLFFVCCLAILSSTFQDKIPVELIVFRSSPTEKFYEDSIKNVVQDYHWTFQNSLPSCSGSLYKCACDELDKVTAAAQPRQMIILVVEDLAADAVCPYTPHKNSPLLLQIFRAEESGPDHAIIALSSPAGRLHYEVPQQNFSEQIINVFDIMNIDYNSSIRNPNTPPMALLFDPTRLPTMLKQNQENIEADKTPIGYIHLVFGLIIIFIAMVIGFLSVDHDPFFAYQIKATNDI